MTMKCNHIKKNKERCKAEALRQDTKCYLHSKKIPEAEKHKARSDGGKSKLLKVNGTFEHYELNTIEEVKTLSAHLINSVLQNGIELRLATGLMYLINTHYKLIELSAIENKLFEIENNISENNRISDNEL